MIQQRASVKEEEPSRWNRRLVFGTFVGLGALVKLTQHKARELQYNFLCPIIVISLAKLACSLVLYVRFDKPLRSIPAVLQSVRGLVLRYSVVAALYCLYDVLSFVNLGLFDPQTYSVFLQLRTVLTGAVWEIAFAKRLTQTQRGALALTFLSCVVKLMHMGFSWSSAAEASLVAYGLLSLQVAANCLGGVANELLLKSKGSVPLNLQNIVLYAWSVLWCLAVGLLCPLDGVHLNPLDLEEWAKMADVWMVPNIVVLTLLGIITSLMLKLLDSMWKAIATAVELFLTSYASRLVFGYQVRANDLLALSLAGLGVGLYAHGGLAPASQFPPRKKICEV